MKRHSALLLAVLMSACVPTPGQRLAEATVYWADTDWNDPATARDPEAIEARFARYVELLEDERLTPARTGPLLAALLAEAENEDANFLLLRELCEKYLYSPESPLRNDELYLHALGPIIGSSHLTDYEKLRPRYQQNMARRNRPGTPAADFDCVLTDGRLSSLYALEAEYTLLFFTDPTCGECAEAVRQLKNDRRIRRPQRQGHLRILAVYSSPEEEFDLWRTHAASYPASWIAAYDPGAKLHYEGRYDLRQVPCFYLLDARKRVVVKGACDIRRITRALRKTNEPRKNATTE